jgi:23S rRNA (cytidine1920-2'-O)/16S rRNA (cytidine1409-2'-O)-methyltransferase
MGRQRLDAALAERGLAPSRSAAAASIRAGMVRVGRGEQRASKPSQLVEADTPIRLEEGRRYVSRGGLKLEAALDRLGVDPTGLSCLDVGASTGGFSDCLLQRGAVRVAAVDVGRGQLDWSLRNDERVVAMEGVNARDLTPEALPFAADLAVIDVSFISLRKLLAAVASCVRPEGRILAMVKPQFELGKGRVKGGVVRDLDERREAVEGVVAEAEGLGLKLLGAAEAGVPGPKGNREVFVLLGRAADAPDARALLEEAVT